MDASPTPMLAHATAADNPASGKPAKRSRPRLNAADLRIACMRVSRRVRHESPGEVRPGQFGVLANLVANGPKTPGELANDECVQAPSMTRTITGLQDKGWVTRTDHPTDRRQVLVSITDSGKVSLRSSRLHRDEWMARRVATLSDDEKKILAEATPILLRLANS